jgi:hypothetical protein
VTKGERGEEACRIYRQVVSNRVLLTFARLVGVFLKLFVDIAEVYCFVGGVLKRLV